MIQLNRFPGGRRKAVTFSYDDGHENDVRLIELFNRYGMKGTFHLNGIKYQHMNAEERAGIRRRYEGHEISCHTLRHGELTRMTYTSLVREVMEDRRILEDIAGYPVVGMSYPNGRFSPNVEEALRCCGIVYSRTTVAAMGNIELPEDFLAWHPSCHHRDALPVARRFLEGLDSEWPRPLLDTRGHSHEFRTEEDWTKIEEIVSLLAGHDDLVWYATNIELYDYTMAQRALRVSAEETVIQNPSAIPVWVERDKKDIIEIGPGETVRL